MLPGEPNLPLKKPLSLRQRKILLRKRNNILPSRPSIPPGKRNISSFKNARGFSIDRAAFTDVAGDNSKSVTGFVMEGASDVHIQNVNMGNQDIQDGSDALVCLHALPFLTICICLFRRSENIVTIWASHHPNNLRLPVIYMPDFFYPKNMDILCGSKILMLVFLPLIAPLE
jgi:hypothetical protein